jgi:hypothetical protein
MPSPVYAEFHADRAATGPFTWGQVAIWKSVLMLRPEDFVLNIQRVFTVPARAVADVPAVAAAFSVLLGRHEALRTTFHDHDGVLTQSVAATGRLPLGVVTAPPAQAAAVAQALSPQLAATTFDYPAELPVRVTLVCTGDRVSHCVLAFNHVAVDIHAVGVVLRELRTLLVHRTVPEPPAAQPLDVADRERGASADRSARSVAYWLARHREIPPVQFRPVRPGPHATYAQLVVTSPAAYQAAVTLAARHRASTSTVILAATAQLITRWTGHRVCALHTFVNNRYQPGHADLVLPMNQLALVTVDTGGDADLDRLVPVTWKAALTAYRHAYYDQAALDDALAALERDTGIETDPLYGFNDQRRPDPEDCPPAVGSPAPTTRAWVPVPNSNWRFYLELRDAADGPDALCALLTADTRYLPEEAMDAFLRDLETTLCTAALVGNRP